jgi:transposase
MLYAAIDIYKRAFQAAVLDPESGEVVEERVSWIPRRRSNCSAIGRGCARRWPRTAAAGVTACTPICSTRADPARSNLLRPPGLRWAASLRLPEHARLHVDSLLSVMAALEAQLDSVDAELRRFARKDERCQALQSIYGVGPILACHLLAEIGEARRFRRPDQITRLAGLDPVIDESGESRRRGHLAKAGSPHLRWALVEAAVHAHRPTHPDLGLYRATRERRHTAVAQTDHRPQDRQASLPRPARARACHHLTDASRLDALRFPPEPGTPPAPLLG